MSDSRSGAESAADATLWTHALTVLTGMGLVSAAAIVPASRPEQLNVAVVGAGVGLVGAYNLVRLRLGDDARAAGRWVVALLGLWLSAVSIGRVFVDGDPLAGIGLVVGAALCAGTTLSVLRPAAVARPIRPIYRPTLRPAVARIQSPVGSVRDSVGGNVREVIYGEGLRLNLIAILIGVIAGLGAVVFRLTIWAAQEVFFGASLNPGAVTFAPVPVPNLFDLLAPLGTARYLLVPAVGGLLVGGVVRATTTAVSGHGVPEVLEKLLMENGRIDPKISLYKTIASSIAIGSGGSLGREGPIVQIGSAAGSYFGEFVDSRYTRTLVAAGAGGGIAATFNTPIAGVMFALEILLAEYYLRNVIVVVLSAVTATAVARAVLGFTPAPGVQEFLVPVHYRLVSPLVEFPLYVAMGVVVAVVGVGVVKLLYATEHRFLERLDLPVYAKPAIGGALLGLSVLLTAVTLGVDELQSASWLFGVGYETIHAGIAGELTLSVLVVLLVMKTVGFSLSVGSGSSGGVFSPSLYVGAMTGGAFGMLVNAAFAGTAGAGAYALVGTAGVFAAAASAPLTATLVIFELTGQYTIILPLLVVTVVGSEVAQFLLDRGTIYTEKLRDQGITVQERRIGSLEDLTAKDVMTADIDTITAGTPISKAFDVFQRTSHRGLPIVDDGGDVAGILVRSDLEGVLTLDDGEDEPDLRTSGDDLVIEAASDCDVTPETPVEEIGTTGVITASPHSNLLTLVDRMVSRGVGRVPVVEDGELIGIVTRTDVLAAYDQVPTDEIGERAAD